MIAPPLSDELTSIWNSACDDAGFVDNEDCILLTAEGKGNGPSAYHSPPGWGFGDDGFWDLTVEQREVMNLTRLGRNLHRILLREPIPSRRATAAKLRHELEHAIQWEADPSLYRFSAIQQDLVESWARDSGLANIRGVLSIYNLIPLEIDANQSAGLFSESLFGRASAEEAHGDNGVLFRDPRVPDRATLRIRSIAFALMFESHLPKVCNEDELLKLLKPEEVSLWMALVDEVDHESFLAQATQLSPSAGEVAQASAPRDAWTTCIESLKESQDDLCVRISSLTQQSS